MMIPFSQGAASHTLNRVIVSQHQKTLPSAQAKQSKVSLMTRAQRHQALREAVLRNDLQRAHALIQAGTSVRLRVRPSSVNQLHLLPGISVPTKRDEEPTLLMIAVAQHEHAMVDLLLRKRAPVDAVGSAQVLDHHEFDASHFRWLHDGTALHLAVMQNDLPMVDRLLKAGASVNIPDAAGRTPLKMAAEQGDPELYATLKKVGATGNYSIAKQAFGPRP